MDAIQHNLEKEKRLIELLGYSLVGPDASNRWLIVDENQNQVGYIQYKKLHNGNSKKEYSKIFGYHTFINSSNIVCKFLRQLNDKDGKIIDSTDCSYSFDIKRDNQETDHVEMNIRDFPSLTVWSEKYGFIDFKVDYQGLYLNLKSKTDKFNIEEVLIYRNIDDEYHDNKKYVYQIRYCKKDLELSDYNLKGRTTREISGTQYNENQLRIAEKTWVGGNLRTNRESVVEGTIEEMATKHQIGIDCFSHFRFLINQIIPFNEDVISVIVNDDKVKQNNLSIFFPDYEKEISETPVQKKLTPNKNKNYQSKKI